MILMLAENFRANVKRRRRELGMSQTELAKRLNIAPSNVASLENGVKSPTTDTIERVASALNCDPLALLVNPVAEAVG